MKIQLASDLHLDFLQHDWPGERLIEPAPGADVLILAGDIADGVDPFRIFSGWTNADGNPIPTIFVAGNHEFYHHAMPPMQLKLRDAAALNKGINYLENNTVVIGETRFLGCTLWTDYKLRSHLSQAAQMTYAEHALNDHRLIRTGRHPFTAQNALDLHVESRAWLESELAKPWAGKTVVVTHHGPHPLSVHSRYGGDTLSSAFVSDLSEILLSERAPDLWLHGHVHDGFDYTVGRTRVVANPAGYIRNRRMAASREDFVFENETFSKQLVIDI
jgi:3',5'-cyclic AMP phosphodiesterase CpdA